MKSFHLVTFTLLAVGGLNWLALGAFNWDLGQLFGGQDAIVSRAIYVLVGLAAVFELAAHKKMCKLCGGSEAPTTSAGVGM